MANRRERGSHVVRVDDEVAAEIERRAIPGESVNTTLRRVAGLDPAPGGHRRRKTCTKPQQ